MLPAKKLSSHHLLIGTNVQTNNLLSLCAEWLRTGLHLIGPTGSGKSFFLFLLFQLVTKIRHATIILFDPKGDFYRMARDWAILHGLTDRLVLFDLGDPEFTIGYNNLRPNDQPVASHVKFVREGIRSAWGQSSFDHTPQLARILFMVLYVARSLELGLLEAVGLLRPGAGLRKIALAKLPPCYVRDALAYFDSLPARRQEELAASTLARLEPFVADPQIARTVGQRECSLELGALLKRRQILLVNLEHYRPLNPDDSRLIGRMLVNDVLMHVFERSEQDRDPVILLADECQEIATRDFCAALDRGRGLGLCTILAHQHLSQLADEDKTGYLLNSVMNDARTKIIFGGNSVADLEQLVSDVLLDQYDPWSIKDEITNLECEPVEETRESITQSAMRSRGRGLALPTSVAHGESDTLTEAHTRSESQGTQGTTSQAGTKGTNRGTVVTRGISDTHTDTWSTTHTDAEHWADTDSEGETSSEGSHQSFGRGTNNGTDFGYTWDPEGNWTSSLHFSQGRNVLNSFGSDSSRGNSRSSAHTRGGSASDAVTEGEADARTISASVGEQNGESESVTRGKTAGTSREQGQAVTTSRGKTTGITTTRGETPSMSEEERIGISTTTSPFHAYKKRRVVSSRTFLSKEEFLTLGLQKIKGQPVGHFLIKVPTKPAVFVRAPRILPPRVTARQLAEARKRIFSQPYYTRITDVSVEEKVPRGILYQEKQLVTSHADATNKRTPRKPRRPKAAPAS